MNSKKILSVFLVLLMTLSLVACNSKENNTTNNDNETIVQETETKQEEVVTTEEVSKEEATIVVQEETKEEVKEEVKEESKEKDRSNYSYWVNFLNPDGSVIERKAYKYGETPTYPSNPTYSDNRAIYEFVGWDKKLSPVTMTQNYAAIYMITGYLGGESGHSESSNKLVRFMHTSVCGMGFTTTDYIEFDLSSYTQEQVDGLVTIKDLYDLIHVGDDVFGTYTKGGVENGFRLARTDLSSYHIPGMEGIDYEAFDNDVYGYHIGLGTDPNGEFTNCGSITDDTLLSAIYFNALEEIPN